MLEALAAGTPVAAFPVTGPIEVLAGSRCGVMNEDLRTAALTALEIPRDACKAFAARHGMRESAAHFFSHVAAVRVPRLR
jgi:glycosyltransferase involved in cell wall biosynthesis